VFLAIVLAILSLVLIFDSLAMFSTNSRKIKLREIVDRHSDWPSLKHELDQQRFRIWTPINRNIVGTHAIVSVWSRRPEILPFFNAPLGLPFSEPLARISVDSSGTVTRLEFRNSPL
jgi:hypothetical protein